MTPITSVPLLDTRRANMAIINELRDAFERTVCSGKFILGDEVEAFERECAQYLGVEAAVGVSSGTDALLVALMALDIKAGDEVICPTFTFFATAGSIWRVGARPVFVDSRRRCFNCDPEDVARKITPRTKAIMPVHLFGQAAEMEPLWQLAKKHGIPIIEDAAQAIGAAYQGRKVGGLGTCGCFSFFPSKNVGGYGDAGLVTTNDPKLASHVKALRTHGGAQMYEHPEVGGNFRIDALQAAMLRPKIGLSEAYARGRQRNAALYNKLFEEAGVGAPDHADAGCGSRCLGGKTAVDAALLLPIACQSQHVFNQYVIRVRGGKRDALMAKLKEKSIGCAIYYPKPLHLQPCFASLGHKAGEFPVAEELSREVLALPVFGELSEDEVRYVADTIIAWVREGR